MTAWDVLGLALYLGIPVLVMVTLHPWLWRREYERAKRGEAHELEEKVRCLRQERHSLGLAIKQAADRKHETDQWTTAPRGGSE
jgi:hypothetical protein